MLFPEEDTPHLKRWIVKRLENTSDADADVLADYVIALLRHDGDVDTVRRLCEDEIPDFLKEDSTIFVRDVFNAIQHKSYLPGAPPAPSVAMPSVSQNLPAYGNLAVAGAPRGPQNGTRKRSFMDRGDMDAQERRDMSYGGNDLEGRQFKQPRRGGNIGRGGRYDNFGMGRGGRQNAGMPTNMPAQGYSNMPGMASSSLVMPALDPNDPMSAILAMQSMFPGMPQFPGSPAGQAGPTGLPPVVKKGKRCRDYDIKGYCARGNACMYEHGTDSIYVTPTTSEEYDPANASLMTGVENTSLPQSSSFRGNDRGRGRGRGQMGERGGRRGGRAEFSSDRANFDKSKTAIVVENIPEEKFSEDEVRGFFSQFGNILEITMQPYKRLAIVKFEEWNSAKEAYNSPKVIFDNRFVKVYWYNSPESLPQPPKNGAAKEVHSRNGLAPPNPAREGSESKMDLEEFARKQEELQKLHEEKAKKKAEMEAAQKELEKRQGELWKKQTEEKKKLLEKIAAKSGKPVEEQNETAPTSGASGSQTEALKAQLAALQAEAKSLGLDTSLADDSSWGGRGRGRGRGGYRARGAFVPRGRGSFRGRGGFAGAVNAYKLDNRPKKIAITGVDFTEPEKDETLRQYLLGVGEFTELETTPDHTSITFKDRATAEKFFYGAPNGEIPSVGKVQMTWVQTPLPPVSIPTAVNPAKDTATQDLGLQDGGNVVLGDSGKDYDGGDAMVQDHDPSGAVTDSHPRDNAHQPQHGRHQNMDYDVADDNDWS